MPRVLLFLWFLGFLVLSCRSNNPNETHHWIGHEVTVSAYNNVPWQTDGDSDITAFGYTLKPGLKAIAVSRDLLKKGLKHNTMVLIDGFKDTFLVKDKMHYRWRNRIDIFMGKDVKKAREWGKQKKFICYAVPIEAEENK